MLAVAKIGRVSAVATWCRGTVCRDVRAPEGATRRDCDDDTHTKQSHSSIWRADDAHPAFELCPHDDPRPSGDKLQQARIANESVSIQLAQCGFPGLAISNVKKVKVAHTRLPSVGFRS